MRPLAALLLLVLLCSPARGQSAATQPSSQPAQASPQSQPRPPVQPGPLPTSPLRGVELCPRGDERCLRQLLMGIPEYQQAQQRGRLGVVLTAVGAGVGAAIMVAAGFSAVLKYSWCGRSAPCWPIDYSGEKIAAGIGGAMLVAGLAAGIPLIISARSERRAIRARYLGAPVLSLGTGPGGTALTARWRF